MHIRKDDPISLGFVPNSSDLVIEGDGLFQRGHKGNWC